METPSKGEPASAVTSVQVLGPDGEPEPSDRDTSWLIPVMALLIMVAFGGGYLLARNPGRTALPETEATLSTTTTARSTTSSMPAHERIALEAGAAGWFALPPPVLADGVTLVAREVGQWVNDVAVDSGGYVWSLGSGVATRWDPADGTSVTFGGEVFGYAEPGQVAAGPDGVVWITAGGDVFRFEGTWARFRIPDTDDSGVTGPDVGPDGQLAVVVGGDWFVTLYRTGPGGDLATAEAVGLPIADVTDMTAGPQGEILLAGSDADGWQVFTIDGNRLTTLPRPAHNPVSQIAATDRVWVTDPQGGALYGLEDGEWVEVDLPDTGPAPWGGRYPWTIGADGDAVWAAAATPDGSGLQIVRVEAPGSVLTYPSFDGAWSIVSSIEVSPDGVVWLGTEAGLCSFDPTTGAWGLWTPPPAEGSIPAGIDSVAATPDGRLLAALYADSPRIGSFDGSAWELEDALTPASCNKGADCDVELSAWRDGTAWAIFMDRTANRSILWRRGTEGTWDQIAMPEQLREGSLGAGPDGTLWLMQSPRTAYFDGAAWTVWYQADVPEFDLWVEEDGTPWALRGGWAVDPSLWVFREGTWSRVEPPLPDAGWPGAVASHQGAMWVAANDRVWSFDGATWTLRFEAGAMVSSLAPAPGGGMWVAAGDLWLIGDGLPKVVAQGLDAGRLVPAPDGSLWALAGGGLYHVEYPG